MLVHRLDRTTVDKKPSLIDLDWQEYYHGGIRLPTHGIVTWQTSCPKRKPYRSSTYPQSMNYEKTIGQITIQYVMFSTVTV